MSRTELLGLFGSLGSIVLAVLVAIYSGIISSPK